MAKKKRTGLLVATGCGLLLCIPLCLGALSGAGGLVYWLGVSEETFSSWDKTEQFDPDRTTETAALLADEATDNDLEPEEMDADFDSGLFDDEEAKDDDARIVIEDEDVDEDDGVAPVTITRRLPQPTTQDDNDDRDVMADLAALDDMEFEDEEDFDDIAAEIAALDSLDDLDDLDDQPTKKKSAPSNKPGTIKVSGDYDRASVIGSDGVYRSPGKFDPGTYRLEITLDDGSMVSKTVKLKGGQTIKFKCNVDAGDCSR